MNQADDMLERIQDDTFQILKAVPGLATVNVFANNEGDIENKVLRALQTLTEGGTGKIGLAVVVLLPEVTDPDTNLPGPVVTVRQEIQIIEHVTFNRSANGTGIRSSAAALRVLMALHLQTVGNRTVHADTKEAVFPVPMKDKNMVCHSVAIIVRSNQLAGPEKTAAIHPDGEAGLFTLTCATPDAVIRYTTDGSYPSPDNDQAATYTGPVAISEVTTIRAAAYAPNLNPGDCIEFIATPSTP